jgi:hypothetical protein
MIFFLDWGCLEIMEFSGYFSRYFGGFLNRKIYLKNNKNRNLGTTPNLMKFQSIRMLQINFMKLFYIFWGNDDVLLFNIL